MPSHPTPPTDLAGIVAGYEQCAQAVVDLGRGCTAEDFALPTVCPGWTVHDQVAHIVAVETYLETGEHIAADLSDPPEADFTRWIEEGVQSRRSVSDDQLLDDLEAILRHRSLTLSDPELTLTTPVRGPLDSRVPLGALLKLRLIDIWVHQQDVREALGRPGDLDTPAAATFVDRIASTFPELVHKRVGLGEGDTVIVESTGPVTARMGVRIVTGADGELLGHPLFTGETDTPGEDTTRVLKAGPTTSISLSTDALTRRSAGRRSTAETSYRVVGDDDVARRVIEALPITP